MPSGSFALLICLLALVCVQRSSLKILGETDSNHGIGDFHIEINEETGEISVELSDGSVRHFDKAPFRPLGGQELQFDPDTFRGIDGSNVVVLEFGRDEDGNPREDFDGIIHLDGVAYDVVADGEISETDNVVRYEATLKQMKIFDEESAATHRGKDVLGAGKSRETRAADMIKKRQSSPSAAADYDKLWLELALYADQAVWELFLNHSDGNETEATTKINSFMQGVVDIVAVDYLGLIVPIDIVVTEYEVWKTQPSEFEAVKEEVNSGYYYIEAAQDTTYAPDRLGSDHTAIISAYPMPDLYGVTNDLATICNDPNEAISATGYQGKNFELAEVLAHEIGHSLASAHDGTERKPESECAMAGSIMAGWGALGASAAITWSECSRDRVEIERKNWDANDNNCLLNKPDDRFFPTPGPTLTPGNTFAAPTLAPAPTPEPPCDDFWETGLCEMLSMSCVRFAEDCRMTCGLCTPDETSGEEPSNEYLTSDELAELFWF